MPNISHFKLGKEFTELALTNWINRIDVQYNLIGQLGIFKKIPIDTTVVGIESRDTQTQLVLARPRDIRDNYLPNGVNSTRKIVYFDVPHLPVDDVIAVSDFQNVRAIGSNQLETQRELIQRRLTEAKINIMATVEYLMMGALRGRIYNADGTLLYDLFKEFNKNQTTVDFGFSGLSEMQSKCNDVTRAIDLALGGDTLTGYAGFASDTFFDSFVTNDSTKEAFAGYPLAEQRLGGDVRRGFRFAGIDIYNYNPIMRDSTGATVKFITEGEAIFFPVGTRNTFQYIMAPANTIATANTMGIEFYSRSWESLDGQAIFIRSEANILPVCVTPSVLVKGTS